MMRGRLYSLKKKREMVFYIHNNKSENYSKNNKCTGIYNVETGNKDYKLMVDTLNNNQGITDTIDFADDYYRVIKHREYGGEGRFGIDEMKVYSYDGEEIASSSYDSIVGGGSLDTSAYPCNNRQIIIDFEKVDNDSSEYWMPDENLLAK